MPERLADGRTHRTELPVDLVERLVEPPHRLREREHADHERDAD